MYKGCLQLIFIIILMHNFIKVVSPKRPPIIQINQDNSQSSQSNSPSPPKQVSPSKKAVGAYDSLIIRRPSKFTFNINQFQKGKQKGDSTTQSQYRESLEEQKQNKRNIIYNHQSYQQKAQEDKQIMTTAQSNNDLFSMVFLTKSNPKPEDNIIPPILKSQQKPEIQKPVQTNTIVSQPPLKISDFEVGKKLGTGKFGQVFLARHKQTGFFCALKMIEKSKIDGRLAVQLVREIKIQTFLNHPNIVKMYSFFTDSVKLYFVMELCYSGQLYSYLKKWRRLPEESTKAIVQQICRALDYMHMNQIIHRDLKPENIIYQSGLVKICDFGWSIGTNTMRGTFCGTPLYVSPQLLKRQEYNNKIDVWSVGILTYELLFGKVPFEIQTEQDFVKIVEDEIKFSKITKVSAEAKDFILSCLQKDPRDRYTVTQLLQHAFLSKIEGPTLTDMY